MIRLEIRETGDSGNSAGSSRAKTEFRFIAGDNGKGMSANGLDRAMDPFVTDGVKHPGRKVGLGIPFLIQTTVDSGGGWRISTTRGGEKTVRSGGIGREGSENSTESESISGASGTTVEAWFDLTNVDTPPVGDIPGMFRSVLMFAGPEEIALKRRRVSSSADLDYEVKKTELAEALGGLEDVSSLVLLGKYLRSLEGIEDEEEE